MRLFASNFFLFQRLASEWPLAYNTASIQTGAVLSAVGPLAQLVERVTLNH